jgi:hypothetical protein
MQHNKSPGEQGGSAPAGCPESSKTNPQIAIWSSPADGSTGSASEYHSQTTSPEGKLGETPEAAFLEASSGFLTGLSSELHPLDTPRGK